MNDVRSGELAGIRVAGADWEGALEAAGRAARFRPELALEMKAYMALAAPPRLQGIRFGEITDELEAWEPVDEDLPPRRGHNAPHAGLHPWLRLYLLGLLEARPGQIESALGHAQTLARAEPPEGLEEWLRDLEAIIRAEVARAEGDPTRALDLLGRAPLWTVYRLDPRFTPILAHFYPVLLRAELLMDLGRPHEALRWYQSLTMPFWMPTDAIGTRVMIGTARAQEAIGNHQTARALRQEVLRRWPDVGGVLGRSSRWRRGPSTWQAEAREGGGGAGYRASGSGRRRPPRTTGGRRRATSTSLSGAAGDAYSWAAAPGLQANSSDSSCTNGVRP